MPVLDKSRMNRIVRRLEPLLLLIAVVYGVQAVRAQCCCGKIHFSLVDKDGNVFKNKLSAKIFW